MIHYRLVKAGYGTLEEVRKLNARDVIQALHYESFLSSYEAAYVEMVKNEDR